MFNLNDIRIPSNVSSSQLKYAISKISPNHKLGDLFPYFVEVESKYNINSIILLSIACLESGYGKSKLAVEKNNLFGLDAPLKDMDTNKYGKSFSSKQECIYHAGHRLGKQYLELDTSCKWRYVSKPSIYEVGKKWCEVSDWATKVISIARRIEQNIINKGDDVLNVLIMAGHTIKGRGTGAVGYINESKENRIIANKVVEYINKSGHKATFSEVNVSNNHLVDQAKIANKGNYDLVVQIHFNSGGGVGTETFYSSNRGKPYAEKVTKELGKLYKQRGAKHHKSLHWLNNTKAPAILVEVCFVDSKVDTDKYVINRDSTARLIAEGIIGQKILEKPSKPNVEPNNNTLYRVVIGTCNKANAEKLKAEAISKGFKDTFLVAR